jgi:hypothetical protein
MKLSHGYPMAGTLYPMAIPWLEWPDRLLFDRWNPIDRAFVRFFPVGRNSEKSIKNKRLGIASY